MKWQVSTDQTCDWRRCVHAVVRAAGCSQRSSLHRETLRAETKALTGSFNAA